MRRICEVCNKRERVVILKADNNEEVDLCEVCIGNLLNDHSITDVYGFRWEIKTDGDQVRVTLTPGEEIR